MGRLLVLTCKYWTVIKDLAWCKYSSLFCPPERKK
jgi:hypothetical protein